MLGITQGTLSKSTEKLSSGYKINRAADDAAGLSISEKMRKQIRGLTQASANAEDGISTVQTAEGALSEVQDMLQRMNELAVKSANGTNSDSDRSYIQSEIDQLTTEIDRVAQTTKFNETYLLKGDNSLERGYSYNYVLGSNVAAAAKFNSGSKDAATQIQVSSCAFTSGVVDNATVNELVKSMRDQGITVTASNGFTSLTLNGDAASNYKVVNKATGSGASATFEITDLQGNTFCEIKTVIATSVNSTKTFVADKDSYSAQTSNKELNTLYDADGNAISANALDNYFSINGGTIYKQSDAGQIYDAVGKDITQTVMASASKYVGSVQDQTAALNIKFQVGADTSSSNKISVNIDSISAKGLGINGLKVSTTTTADAAVNTISEAIQKVSKQRSALGAIQNRLEHTINNLDNVVENTTSAESQIRDTDMATEMVTYSNANILSQAGQAMLAQSNQSNQGVLSLLG
jgi:flagellin